MDPEGERGGGLSAEDQQENAVCEWDAEHRRGVDAADAELAGL